jgi:hypothetical protein
LALPLEQKICLHAAMVDGRLVPASLSSTRTASIPGVLAAQPVGGVPHRLSQLFPLCGTAHAMAGLMAIEAALRIEASPAQRAFRALVALVEHGAASAWRIMMDWPPLLGEPPQIRAYAAIHRIAAAVRTAADRDRWAQPGGARLRLNRDDFGRTVAGLARVLNEAFPEAADRALGWGALQRAVQDGASLPARLISAAHAGALAAYGCHDRPLLPALDADWVATRLAADPGFGDAPTLNGTPAEVGALASRRHPLVDDAIVDWGPTLATRLLAAALDCPVVADRLRHALDDLADDDPVAVDLAGTGRGAGVVETSRGPLAYLIDTSGGQVRMLRSVAPTEWNFHPDGPFISALTAAPKVPDPVFAARLLATSFDPCVLFCIELAAPNATDAAHA